MTTFRALIYADNKRQDGTYNVKIRLTHRRQSLKVSTNIYVGPHQLTKSLKIKDASVIDNVEDLIRRWRGIVGNLGVSADLLTAHDILNYIRSVEARDAPFHLDFISFGRQLASNMKQGTGQGYLTALNALIRFVGRESVDISEITVRFLREFERFLETEPILKSSRAKKIIKTNRSKAGGRAVSSYLAAVRHIHNCAKAEFNDEDSGLIRIPQSPFAHFKVKAAPAPKKRAVDVEVIQQIIDLGDEDHYYGSRIGYTRRDLARDCFLLSLGLAGMNAADLRSCPYQDISKGVIVYNRQKTADRRSDKAEMHIRIEPQLLPLVKKYLDPTRQRLFVFHRMYNADNSFSAALNQGLARISAAISAPHITFYSARHSWATLARSSALNIDKYTVHEGLNHVSENMRITDRYIARDWSNVWNANKKVIDLFNWTKLAAREKK